MKPRKMDDNPYCNPYQLDTYLKRRYIINEIVLSFQCDLGQKNKSLVLKHSIHSYPDSLGSAGFMSQLYL